MICARVPINLQLVLLKTNFRYYHSYTHGCFYSLIVNIVSSENDRDMQFVLENLEFLWVEKCRILWCSKEAVVKNNKRRGGRGGGQDTGLPCSITSQQFVLLKCRFCLI